MKLKDKVVIVTGAGRGIGKAIASTLAAEGAWLALVARTEKELLETQKEIRVGGGKAICIVCDIRDSKAVSGMMEEVIRQFQGIDILINNAGIFYPNNVVDCTDEEWQEILDVNLTGLFYCTRAVLPLMFEKGSGQIMNIVSGAGVHAFPGAGAYCASKFGVMGFSETLLEEVREKGVKVTVLLPGMVDTGMIRDDVYSHSQKIRPQDVADAVLFAATAHKNTFVNRVEVRHILPGK